MPTAQGLSAWETKMSMKTVFRNRWTTLFTCLILLLACHTTLAQDANVTTERAAEPIRWKFATGDAFSVTIHQETSVNTKVDVRNVAQSNQMDLTIDWAVQAVDKDGTATIDQKISKIVASITIPDKTGKPVVHEYDSSVEKHRGDARILASSLSKLLDQTVTITMSSRGEITDVKIPEETLDSMRQMPGSIEGRQAFSTESLREIFQSTGTELPESAIAVGESWLVKRAFSIGSPHQFTRETTYTLAAGGEINVESTLVLNSVAAAPAKGEAEFDTWAIEEQKSTGMIQFDLQAGNASSSDSETMLKTKTNYQGMAVTTTMNSQVKTSIERK